MFQRFEMTLVIPNEARGYGFSRIVKTFSMMPTPGTAIALKAHGEYRIERIVFEECEHDEMWPVAYLERE